MPSKRFVSLVREIIHGFDQFLAMGCPWWLAPIFLLHFAHGLPPAKGLPIILVIFVIASGIANWGIIPVQGITYFGWVLLMALASTLPYLADRLAASRLPGVVSTLTVKEQDTVCRVEAGERLNRGLNGLLAYCLTHLCFEEDSLLPVTCRALTDEEIIGIRIAIQWDMPAERYEEFLKVMLASANNPELVSILAGTEAGAPPSAVRHLVQLFEQVLSSPRVQLLRERAGVCCCSSGFERHPRSACP